MLSSVKQGPVPKEPCIILMGLSGHYPKGTGKPLKDYEQVWYHDQSWILGESDCARTSATLVY